MSKENVDLIRRAVETLNQGELQAIHTFVEEACDPEVEWHTSSDLPDSGVYRGRDNAVEVSALSRRHRGARPRALRVRLQQRGVSPQSADTLR
jgi:hypothetical protein